MRRFFSVQEDLRVRTLASLPNALAKVLYMASLTDTNQAFTHAGLERTHGVESARAALQDAFRQGCLELLAVPFGSLFADLQKAGVTPERLSDLRVLWERQRLGGVTSTHSAHFSYVIDALALILEEPPSNQAA